MFCSKARKRTEKENEEDILRGKKFGIWRRKKKTFFLGPSLLFRTDKWKFAQILVCFFLLSFHVLHLFRQWAFIDYVISGMTKTIRLDCTASQLCQFMRPFVNIINYQNCRARKQGKVSMRPKLNLMQVGERSIRAIKMNWLKTIKINWMKTITTNWLKTINMNWMKTIKFNLM